jgi:hypothetical protein
MRTLIRTIFGLAIILYNTITYAGPEGMQHYPWTLQQAPIWCGPLDVVNQALKKEGYVEKEIAVGRTAALPTGDIVYAVITYVSTETEGHIVRTMETPAGLEKCILNMLFNYTVVESKTKPLN